jgi:hypothetical protein
MVLMMVVLKVSLKVEKLDYVKVEKMVEMLDVE